MAIIDPKDLSTAAFHNYMLGAVTPRPIAFASTIDAQGNVNLSPFSFFNAFGSNPPTLIFAPARRVRDNTTKHTHENVIEVPEVVINIVSYDMVQQVSLASVEYGKGVNEFKKAGFTEQKSSRVMPPRVAEAKIAFECKVKQVIELGDSGGAGNLIICEIILMHLSDKILDENGNIDPFKIDTVGRLGGDWYVRVNGDALFEVPKPVRTIGIGYDQIPEHIRNSKVLNGNDLGKLGNVVNLPTSYELKAFVEDSDNLLWIKKLPNDTELRHNQLQNIAKQYLNDQDIATAWKVLLI